MIGTGVMMVAGGITLTQDHKAIFRTRHKPNLFGELVKRLLNRLRRAQHKSTGGNLVRHQKP